MRTVLEPPTRVSIDWRQLLVDAVNKPGIISDAYNAFWTFSTANSISAYAQCFARGITPGPLHTFRGWIKLGRCVRRGEKALTLIMPVTLKRKKDQPIPADALFDSPVEADQTRVSFTRFIERPFWFTLSQTDGEPYVPLAVPQWNEARALYTLNITREEFSHPNGNVQGCAYGRTVSVSPLAHLPYCTLLHEVAHVLLGHTAEVAGLSDSDRGTPCDLKEVEAECVALLCCASLGMPGEVHSRGYIQHWLKSDTIPERSVQRIFKAADSVLKAGIPPQSSAEAEAPAA